MQQQLIHITIAMTMILSIFILSFVIPESQHILPAKANIQPLSHVKNTSSCPSVTLYPDRNHARKTFNTRITDYFSNQKISYTISLSGSNVTSILNALSFKVKPPVANGYMQNLKESGKYQYQIFCAGNVSKESLTHPYIKKVKMHFLPEKMLRPPEPDREFEHEIFVRLPEKTRTKEYSG